MAALRTYAKLLIKRLGSDDDAIEIVERMIIEQKPVSYTHLTLPTTPYV